MILLISSLVNFNPLIFFFMNLKESGGSIGFIETSVLFSKSLIVSMKMPISPGATIEFE